MDVNVVCNKCGYEEVREVDEGTSMKGLACPSCGEELVEGTW